MTRIATHSAPPATVAPIPTHGSRLGGISDETAGMLLGLIGVAIFSLTLPFTRLAVGAAGDDHGLSPMFVALGRALVAAALAGAWLLWKRAPLPPRPHWRRWRWWPPAA